MGALSLEPKTSDCRNTACKGQAVIDPADWTAESLSASEDWKIVLKPQELDDLKKLAADFRHLHGDDPNALLETTLVDFDLGCFAIAAKQIKNILKDGKGLVLVRGLPLDELELIDVAIIYWAIGLNIGIPASNNPEGDMIGHVTDLGKDQDNPKHRGYQTKATMDYHTDQSNVVGLLCVQTSKSGGESKVVSSVAVYNTLIKRRPDLLDPLTEDFCWSMMGEIDKDQLPYYKSPIFNFLDGYLCTSSGPVHIYKGHNLPKVPDLTDKQKEALDVLHEICEDLHYEMRMQRGDIQFLNNMTVMHNRSEFEDWPEPEKKRRLWRLWLTMPGIRPLTPYMEHWRTGLLLKNTNPHINLSPLE